MDAIAYKGKVREIITVHDKLFGEIFFVKKLDRTPWSVGCPLNKGFKSREEAIEANKQQIDLMLAAKEAGVDFSKGLTASSRQDADGGDYRRRNWHIY